MESFIQNFAIGSGRLLPTVIAVVGLIGVIIGVRAFAHSQRTGAIVAVVLGLLSSIIGGLHAANSAGSFGTGNGLAGAIAAILLGLIGIALGGLVLIGARRG